MFMFREGLARFATEQYKNKNYNNPFIHLTNYAINKDNSNFENPSDENASTGHKRSLKSMFEQLLKDGYEVEGIKGQIREIVVKTIMSCIPDLVHHYRTSQPSDLYNNMCFEILGFDILIDKAGKAWLLEVNHAPSFNSDTILDRKVKRALMHDTLKLLKCTNKEKLQIINAVKYIHDLRMGSVNKTNKNELQMIKHEMQQKKLVEIDAF